MWKTTFKIPPARYCSWMSSDMPLLTCTPDPGPENREPYSAWGCMARDGSVLGFVTSTLTDLKDSMLHVKCSRSWHDIRDDCPELMGYGKEVLGWTDSSLAC